MSAAEVGLAACLLVVGAAVVVAIGWLWAVADADADPQDEE